MLPPTAPRYPACWLSPEFNPPPTRGGRPPCAAAQPLPPADVRNVRQQFPEVAFIAHPECSPEVTAESDYTGSTKQMIEFVRTVDASQYLLLTECSMGDNIVAENPDREILRLCSLRCPHMGQITMEETLAALQHLQYEIHIDPAILERAKIPIDRMLAIR